MQVFLVVFLRIVPLTGRLNGRDDFLPFRIKVLLLDFLRYALRDGELFGRGREDGRTVLYVKRFSLPNWDIGLDLNVRVPVSLP